MVEAPIAWRLPMSLSTLNAVTDLGRQVPFAELAPKREMWVSASAGNGGDGSREHPFNSIQTAVTVAPPGTAIMVQAGTYTENIKFPSKDVGLANAPVWLVSADGPQAAKIYAADPLKPVIKGLGTDNVVVDGFEIHGGQIGIQFSQSGSNFSNMVQNVVIQNNAIYDSTTDGIKISQGNHVYILDNVVRHAGEEGIDFVAVNNSVISRNDISGAAGAAGMFAKGGSTNVLISDNNVHGALKDGIEVGGWSDSPFFVPGFTSYEARNVVVTGNSVTDVGRRAVNVLGAVDSVITNNYLEANPLYPAVIHVGTGNPRATKVMYSAGIEIFGNGISRGDRVLSVDSGNDAGIAYHDNSIAASSAAFRHGGSSAASPSAGASPSASDGADNPPPVVVFSSASVQPDEASAPASAPVPESAPAVPPAPVGLKLFGDASVNTIRGAAGDDQLDGGAGADTLIGLGGDDLYFVDHKADRVIEAAGEGTDAVVSSISYVLAPGQSIELLVASSAASTTPLALTGNELANAIVGNAGDNKLKGGAGADTLAGLGGNDTYSVDDARDQVIEAAGQGNDYVMASVSYQLAPGQEVERLLAENSASKIALSLTGNEFSNQLRGNEGANTLNGGAGADKLTGLGGDDRFVFDAPVNGAGDHVTDFARGDLIALSREAFGGLAPGELDPGAFKNLAKGAPDADDRIFYQPKNGQLIYDPDGSGAAAGVVFATLDNRPAITGTDFIVF